jgi:hypothetical protein
VRHHTRPHARSISSNTHNTHSISNTCTTARTHSRDRSRPPPPHQLYQLLHQRSELDDADRLRCEKRVRSVCEGCHALSKTRVTKLKSATTPRHLSMTMRRHKTWCLDIKPRGTTVGPGMTRQLASHPATTHLSRALEGPAALPASVPWRARSTPTTVGR